MWWAWSGRDGEHDGERVVVATVSANGRGGRCAPLHAGTWKRMVAKVSWLGGGGCTHARTKAHIRTSIHTRAHTHAQAQA